jgi:hypothetical protein
VVPGIQALEKFILEHLTNILRSRTLNPALR